jgi:hypothetical protein
MTLMIEIDPRGAWAKIRTPDAKYLWDLFDRSQRRWGTLT